MRHLLLILTAALGACIAPVDDSDESDLGQVDQGIDSLNGTSLNGTSLNGTSLNGTSLNGTSLNGTSLNGTSLSGTSIIANSTTGTPISGTAAVGSTWNGTASNGAAVKLRIDSVLQGTAPNADLWFYGVSFASTSTTWAPLCGLDASSVPIKAVTVAGVWDTTGTYKTSSTSFTFACRTKTVAKCVELGYKTFKGYANQLASCVRLLRADYCGTGVSNTVDGTLLNLYDNVGVQFDTELWFPEAEWTPTGARCVNSNVSARYLLTGAGKPGCVNKELSLTCGLSFLKGAVLIDELPVQH
jgi:hypothetical protein